jgi:DNA-binding transcriptional ArsR family regulator
MVDDREAVFSAIAAPVRRQLISRLAESSPQSISDLAASFPITRQGISKHLSLMAQAGLVKSESKGREKLYSLSPDPLCEITEWVEIIGDKWEQRLERLKAYVEENQL